MRRVVQISDLHFGNSDRTLLDPLRTAIERIRPDVLVISGDLVEHATEGEFRAAQEFLASLPTPQIVVPGNHDLPFYNLFLRATTGLSRYKKYITRELLPKFKDDEILIIGANTSRFWPIRGGSLSSLQLERLAGMFDKLGKDRVRLLVTHHPFDLPAEQNRRLIVGHAKRSICRLAPMVDVLLSGHIHLSAFGSTATRYRTAGHAIAFVQAGTAVSQRDKGEVNSFNSLRIQGMHEGGKAVTVDRWTWRKGTSEFKCRDSTQFRLAHEGWVVMPDEPEADQVQEEQGVSVAPM